MRLLGNSTQTPARSLHINVESHLVPRDFLINISQTDVAKYSEEKQKSDK